MLHEKIKDIDSRERLADFVAALLQDLESNPAEWENATLPRFLEAMESFLQSMDDYYKNTGRVVPMAPSWSMFADILYASRIYE